MRTGYTRCYLLNKQEINQVINFVDFNFSSLQELVSDVDIKSKTIAKLEAESITKTSEFNSR